MDNETPNQLPSLPGPPAGRNYTRMCISALRRQAQKMPTLSGVADHFEVMDGELGKWEARAREIFATAQQLHDTVGGLKEELASKDSQIEALFDDFAQERDLWDSTQQQDQAQLSHFHEQISQLTQDWAQANEQLAGYIILDRGQKAQIQELSNQLSSLRGLYEGVVRDLDSTQARMEAQLLSQSQIIEQLQDKLLQAQQQHENDLGASLDVIAQLREDLVAAQDNIQALLDQKQVWETQRAAFTRHTGELEDKILNLVQDKVHLQTELDNSYARHADQATALSNQLQQANLASQELTHALEQANHRSEELAKRVSGLESDLDEAMALAAELEGQANTTAQQLSELRVEYQRAIEQMGEQSQQYNESLSEQHNTHTLKLQELADTHAQKLAQQKSEYEQILTSQASEYELQLLALDQELDNFQQQYRKLHEMMEFGTSEHIRAFSDLIDEHNDKLAELTISHDQQLHEVEQSLEQLRNDNAHTKQQLDEANAAKASLSVELFQSQQHALDVEQRFSEASNTIEELTCQLAQAKAQLELIPQLEQKLCKAEDLLQRQSQDLADLEVVALNKAVQSSLYDESVPWDVRAWQGSAGQEQFIPVPGVKQWLDKNGLTLEDLTAVNFPGFTSADREHLAMCAGINVQQFCQLPYVRPWLANKILAQLKSGVSPVAMEGQWQVLSDQQGNTSVRWRVNKLWAHLATTTRVDIPHEWNVYLLAHEIGVPQPVSQQLQVA